MKPLNPTKAPVDEAETGGEHLSRQVRRKLEREGERKDPRQVADDLRIQRQAAEHQARRDAQKDREAAEISRGKRNIYTCDTCFGHIVTVDLVEGVTPFMIRCLATGCLTVVGCNGMMQSSMYRVFDQRMKPSHEWYRPDDISKVEPGARSHVERGGLLLRRFGAKE